MRLGSVFKMRMSILNTATTEQMGCIIFSFFVSSPVVSRSRAMYESVILIYFPLHFKDVLPESFIYLPDLLKTAGSSQAGHHCFKKQFPQSGFLAVQIVRPNVMIWIFQRIQ